MQMLSLANLVFSAGEVSESMPSIQHHVHKPTGYILLFLFFGHEAHLPLDIMCSRCYGGYASDMHEGIGRGIQVCKEVASN